VTVWRGVPGGLDWQSECRRRGGRDRDLGMAWRDGLQGVKGAVLVSFS